MKKYVQLFFSFLFLPFFVLSQQVNEFQQLLDSNHVDFTAGFKCYDNKENNLLTGCKSALISSNPVTMTFNGSEWMIRRETKPVVGNRNAFDITLIFNCLSGKSLSSSVSMNIAFCNWSVRNYVLMPASVYDGNRVESRKIPYCPFLSAPNDIGIDKPQIISDVPRLSIEYGPSRIQQRSGDMSTPSIGFQNPDTKKGCWILTPQGNQLGDYGIDIDENISRTKAVISITSPVVREVFQYFISNNHLPSRDKPADFFAGDSLIVSARIYFCQTPDVQSLYNYFVKIRNDILPQGAAPAVIPFSAAFKIQEEKFNRQNFEKEHGYYSVGLRENCSSDWQIGWVGGMMSTYPLLMLGTEQSRQNVIRNFDWLFPNGISPSGFFWDTGCKGEQWLGIFPADSVAKNLHLVRKSGDGLYYILKQFALFKKLNIPIKPTWENGTRTVADAFVNTWKKYGQLGQFVNNYTGELIIGGSTSGGIVPAALSLAAKFYNDPTYQVTANEIAEYFYKNYVEKGLIYGGPGDAMQNFDSESGYGLLESFTVLYENTRDAKWLKASEDMANQYTTWITSYDYNFPKSCTLGKLGKKTTGTVWANTQNKHAAPGICTHSGVAFLRLYRTTGNKIYLDLLRSITRAIPQYLSTIDNPIPGMQSGWINERVSTTDWLEGIGEIFSGSTWAETSLLLTMTEIPGIYIRPDKGLVYAFDQVNTRVRQQSKKNISIEISNPTKYTAKVKMMIENQQQAKLALAELPLSDYSIIEVKAGEVKIIRFSK